ncbi:MAG: hypothetical protein ACYCTE_14665 [Acidimicrobiales bacterium]
MAGRQRAGGCQQVVEPSGVVSKRSGGCPAAQRRLGYAKANKAIGHSILPAAWHILSKAVPYEDLGEDWFVKRRPEAHARRLAKQIEALGYSVTIAPTEAA